MSNFKVGEKVVCINAESGAISMKNLLVKNEIYTISEIHINGGLFLLEVKTYDLDGFEIPFNENRFRKLDHEFSENLCAKLVEEFQNECVIMQN